MLQVAQFPFHHTNECKVFMWEIQLSIPKGHQKRAMKIDGHLFPMNMIGGSAAHIKKYQVEVGMKRRSRSGDRD
jgi:hypothetical protein